MRSSVRRSARFLCGSLGFDIMIFTEGFSFNIGNYGLHRKVHNLSCDCEVNNLLPQPVWIDLKTSFRGVKLLLVFCKRPGG